MFFGIKQLLELLEDFQTKETQRWYFKVLPARAFVVRNSQNVLPSVLFFGDVGLQYYCIW